MTKERKKSLLAGAELLLIMITILAATYAWFSNKRDFGSEEINIKTTSHFNLLISLDEGQTWLTETALNLPSDFAFKHEITGNGVNMYIPSNKLDDGTPVSFTSATAGSDYLEFNIMFSLSANASIFLDKMSFISPAVGVEPENLIGPSVERISNSGDFSRDLIASSVRVAFIENELIDGQYVMNNTASLVWAPNKDYELSCTDICTANIHSTNTQNYSYIEAANNPVVETNVNNIKDLLSASGEEQIAYGDPKITTIDINDNEGIRKVTVRVWIEGNDRDNITALTGGLFQMNLQFGAIDKGLDNVVPTVLAGENNTIDGYTEEMEYSIDKGLNWIKYQDNNNPTFSSGDSIRVRKSENSMYFASQYITLDF